MKIKTLILFCAFLVTGNLLAQTVNDYKYVIVPERFEFQSETGEFQLNYLTKNLLEKKGFIVFYSGDKLPDEVALDKCKALHADVVRNSGVFNTGLIIKLNDCNGKALFTSIEGKSKRKQIGRAYHEALAKASVSIDAMGYDYNPKEEETSWEVVDQTAMAPQPNIDGIKAKHIVTKHTLFAQPIANGFQLVDSTPKVVMNIYPTSDKGVYIAKQDLTIGVLLNKGGVWFFEYYQENKLVKKKLDIKF